MSKVELKAINMRRQDLPQINYDKIDLSAVPFEMQEKIRNLIMEKAERKITEEMKYL